MVPAASPPDDSDAAHSFGRVGGRIEGRGQQKVVPDAVGQAAVRPVDRVDAFPLVQAQAGARRRASTTWM